MPFWHMNSVAEVSARHNSSRSQWSMRISASTPDSEPILIAPVHKKQFLTYLRLADKPLVALIKDGITRIVNGLKE